MEIRKLGIAGTAKNSGKTTVTSALMDAFRQREVPFVVTSIGYDGEILDNITGLPKPRLHLHAGDMIVTTTKCMQASSAQFETLLETGIPTALGKIMINRVTKAGLAITAGPNKSSEVRLVAKLLEDVCSGVVLFDGALNRIAPIAETDGFVLVTGAARTPDIEQLAAETAAIDMLSRLPELAEPCNHQLAHQTVITLADSTGSLLRQWQGSSWLLPEQVEPLPQWQEGSVLYVPGVLSEHAWQALLEQASHQNPLHLVFSNMIRLLAAVGSEAATRLVTQTRLLGGQVSVIRPIPLLAVTVNPFYPRYRYESKDYTPAYVDAGQLRQTVSMRIQRPVFDIQQDGVDRLANLILQDNWANGGR